MSSQQSNIVLLVTAENKAGQVLEQVQGQAAQTQENIARGNEKTAQSIQKVERNYLQAGAAFAAVGASVVGFATSLDNMERAQLKVDIAQKHVNDLLSKGKEGTEEYRIAAEKLRLSQDNLSDTYTNFVANIGPQIFTTIFGLQAGFRALGITSVTQLIPAIHGVGTALKTAFITNPVGIAIIAVTTVIGLLVFNVGGLRDRVVELGASILAFIDAHLRPLGDAIRFIIDLFRPLADIFGVVMPEEIGVTQDAVKELEGVTVPALQNIEQETVKLGTGIGITTDQINQDMTKMATGVEATVQRNIENFGKMGSTARDAGVDVALGMKLAADVTELQAGRIILAGQAMTKVLQQIQDLQGQSAGVRGRIEQNAPGFVSSRGASGFITTGAQLNAETRIRNEQATIEAEINRLTRLAGSFALAGGISPQALFGGGTTLGGLTFSPNFGQAASAFGTLFSQLGGGQFIPGVDISVIDAILRGFTSNFDVGGAIERLSGSLSPHARFNAFHPIYNPTGRVLTREEFFGLTRAQHGFEGILNKPTLFLAGEAGPEHVKITPGGNGTMKLVVQIIDANGNELGSSTLDDVNKEGVIRIKTRGVRLF